MNYMDSTNMYESDMSNNLVSVNLVGSNNLNPNDYYTS